MNVGILNKADNQVVEQIGNLLRKLSPAAVAPDFQRLSQLINDAGFKLFVASDENGSIVGMLTLTRCHTLAGSKYWIEDVIVDEVCRGKGAGRALVQAAVQHVKQQGGHHSIYLTSNPSRVSARNLYRSEGFEEYNTGVFRIR